MDLLDFLTKKVDLVRGGTQNDERFKRKFCPDRGEIAVQAHRDVARSAAQCHQSKSRYYWALYQYPSVRIIVSSGVEMLCIGYFQLLFAYLRVQDHPELQTRALEVISLAAANQECVGDIAASTVLVHLFLLLNDVPSSASTALSTLFTLSSNGNVVKDALEYGI